MSIDHTRNGNKISLEYHPPAGSRSVILNRGAAVAQSFEVNLPATVGSTNLAQLTSWQMETRLHDFLLPSSGATAIIYSSNSGAGPVVALNGGNLELRLTETGATSGCSVAIGDHSDIVVRAQGESNGQYRLEAWTYSRDGSAPFASGTCPIGQDSSIDVSGLLSIGTDAARTGNALFRGSLAYLRVYTTTTNSGTQPMESPAQTPLLSYTFDAPNREPHI